jgi:hypothetical protein
MKSKRIIEVGYIEKGSGKHQSNIVYSQGELHLHCVLRWVQKPGL